MRAGGKGAAKQRLGILYFEIMVPSVGEGPGRRLSLSGDIGLCSLRLLNPGMSLVLFPTQVGCPFVQESLGCSTAEHLVDMKSWSFSGWEARSRGLVCCVSAL